MSLDPAHTVVVSGELVVAGLAPDDIFGELRHHRGDVATAEVHESQRPGYCGSSRSANCRLPSMNVVTNGQ